MVCVESDYRFLSVIRLKGGDTHRSFFSRFLAQALNDDIAGRQTAVFEAARRGEAISATEESLSVKLLAAGIPKRLIAVQEECKCRVECVESAVSCLSEYETELNSLKNWLAWAEGELSKLKQLQSEPQVVQQQVDECQVCCHMDWCYSMELIPKLEV